MKSQKIVDYGIRCAALEDSDLDQHIKMRVGKGKASRLVYLNVLDARKLAYALLFEADKLSFRNGQAL